MTVLPCCVQRCVQLLYVRVHLDLTCLYPAWAACISEEQPFSLIEYVDEVWNNLYSLKIYFFKLCVVGPQKQTPTVLEIGGIADRVQNLGDFLQRIS